MPDVLVAVDNNFEQRYYRSPAAAARGIWGWLTRDCRGIPNGQVVFYRRIEFNPDDPNSPLRLIEQELADLDRRDGPPKETIAQLRAIIERIK